MASMSDAEDVPPRMKTFEYIHMHCEPKGLEEQGVTVIHKVQMEILTISWRNL